MAKVKCEYCGSFIPDTVDKCPNCGGTNVHLARTVPDTPQTIEELRSWYAARNLPPENVTRFYIGKDVREPRAIGIYFDGRDYIVYKNKANGERAIRYRGTDEAYAVNEVYLKLKETILSQKNHNASQQRSRMSGPGGTRSANQPNRNRKGGPLRWLERVLTHVGIVFAVFMVIAAIADAIRPDDPAPYTGPSRPYSQYYRVDDTYYYYLDDYYGGSYGTGDHSGWYRYDDDSGDWAFFADADDEETLGELYDHSDEYAIGDPYDWNTSDTWAVDGMYADGDNTVKSFEDTDWYRDAEAAEDRYYEYRSQYDDDDDDYSYSYDDDDDYSWDNDSDWDWDSDDDWDSDWGDWDSDW